MNWWYQNFNLNGGLQDRRTTLSEVRKNVEFKGATLWILASAILVASVGLNVNSTAVVIGAMLISPLMGPIIGAGFGLGTYDFSLLRKALKNLLVLTIVSLLVSTIYFYLSPFKNPQSEILARTSPNIYDILIAFFGGLAGVISTTRREKGLPIAGVAIATALMPPLCTAGYGLGTGHFNYFLGAMYLYTINCTFICIATYIIVSYLKYPSKEQVDKKHQRNVRYSITLLIFLMLIPSAYFAWQLYEKQKFNERTERFLKTEFENKGDIILYKKTSFATKPRKLEVVFFSKRFTKNELDSIGKIMLNYNLYDTKLIVKQDSLMSENEIKENQIDAKDVLIARLQEEIKSIKYNNPQLQNEIRILFPQISNLSLANHPYPVQDSVTKQVPVLFYTAERLLNTTQEETLEGWVKERVNLDTLIVVGKRE